APGPGPQLRQPHPGPGPGLCGRGARRRGLMDSQKLQAALAHVEEHRQEYLEKLFDLLRQPSVSSERRGVEECARTLTALLDSFGLKSSLHETGGYPIVYAEAPG